MPSLTGLAASAPSLLSALAEMLMLERWTRRLLQVGAKKRSFEPTADV